MCPLKTKSSKKKVDKVKWKEEGSNHIGSIKCNERMKGSEEQDVSEMRGKEDAL